MNLRKLYYTYPAPLGAITMSIILLIFSLYYFNITGIIISIAFILLGLFCIFIYDQNF